MRPLSVYVLVGGESRRFGSDKATHDLAGTPWGIAVGRGLAAAGGEVVLVGATTLVGCRRIDDLAGCAGPVAGVAAALADAATNDPERRVVVTSCDLVGADGGWLAPLSAALDAEPGRLAAGYHDGRRWQPFPLLAQAAAGEGAAAYAAAGGGSMQGLLDTLEAARVAWPGPGVGPPQANTPGELKAALESGPAEGGGTRVARGS